jgi:hypothetical protein
MEHTVCGMWWMVCGMWYTSQFGTLLAMQFSGHLFGTLLAMQVLCHVVGTVCA